MSYKYDRKHKAEELQDRFMIADGFTEFEYSEENENTKWFEWKNAATGQLIRIVEYKEEVYRYFHYIPHDEGNKIKSKVKKGTSIGAEVKSFAESFLKRMFPKDYDKLILNCKKTSGFESDEYIRLTLEYEQFFYGRHVYSYGATIKLRIYKDDSMLIEECVGSIAHIDKCETPIKLTAEDYVKAFPLKLSYEKYYKKGTLPVYSMDIGFLSELDGKAIDTRYHIIKFKAHGYGIEDDTYYETDEKVLSQMVKIDEKTAYDIIFEKAGLIHVMVQAENGIFLPAITLGNIDSLNEYKIVLNATTGEVMNAFD